MPGIEDWANSPLTIIQNIFDQKGDSNTAAISDYFKQKLQMRNALSWIPSLNDTPLHNLRPNSLVRFRCMIQDMFDPEFYLGLYEVRDLKTQQTSMKCGKYKDIAECGAHQKINLDSSKNVTMDRQTLYCVPVPGETEWVKKTYSCLYGKKCQPSTSSTPYRTKRSFEDNIQSKDAESAMEASESLKTVHEAVEGSMETESSEAKKTKTESGTGNNPSPAHNLNFPLPGEPGPPCLVKIYDEVDGYKVNDVIEVVGVLSVDPALAQFPEEKTGTEEMLGNIELPVEEMNAHAPPPSLVPRLHAVVCQKLSHVNPMLPSSTDDEEYKSVLAQMKVEVETLRSHLLAVLKHCVFGDKLAAEYLLCHLVSTVYARLDVMPIGKFCLNLTKCPQMVEYGDLMHKLISALVTKSYLFPMTIENMNTMKMSPKKDYTANRLQSGILQLSSDTSLVVDESVLKPGQLDPNGVNNMTAFGNVISWQKVEYDFNFHKQDFQTNVGVLILSEGKSILPCDCLLPVVQQETPQNIRNHFTALDPLLTEDNLGKFRTYLTLCKQLEYSINDDLQKFIQEDFVEMRKDSSKNVTVDDLHALLNLARLLSVSYLRTCPTAETWQQAKTMELQRKQRISSMQCST